MSRVILIPTWCIRGYCVRRKKQLISNGEIEGVLCFDVKVVDPVLNKIWSFTKGWARCSLRLYKVGGIPTVLEAYSFGFGHGWSPDASLFKIPHFTTYYIHRYAINLNASTLTFFRHRFWDTSSFFPDTVISSIPLSLVSQGINRFDFTFDTTIFQSSSVGIQVVAVSPL